MLSHCKDSGFFQNSRHIRRTGIESFMIKRLSCQKKEQAQNRVMITKSLFPGIFQDLLNFPLLFFGTGNPAHLIISVRKLPVNQLLFFFFKAGDQRDGRNPPSHTVCLIQFRIQTQNHMDISLFQHPADDGCKQPRRIHKGQIQTLRSVNRSVVCSLI